MISKKDSKLALWNIGVAYIAFLIGTLCGLLQVFIRNDSLQLPTWLDYYQILTAHGVLLALIYTTFFIFAFFIAGMSKTLGEFGPKSSDGLDWFYRHDDWNDTCNGYDYFRKSVSNVYILRSVKSKRLVLYWSCLSHCRYFG